MILRYFDDYVVPIPSCVCVLVSSLATPEPVAIIYDKSGHLEAEAGAPRIYANNSTVISTIIAA